MYVETPLQFIESFLAGGTSGAVAVTVVAPLERIKLILQVQHGASNILPHQKYKGIMDCLIRIPKEEGTLSFWRGNMSSVLRCFPYQALNFSLREL
jgi:solute carrier family 25 (adenine nucleotide translocator) protein 4/5/6/31